MFLVYLLISDAISIPLLHDLTPDQNTIWFSRFGVACSPRTCFIAAERCEHSRHTTYTRSCAGAGLPCSCRHVDYIDVTCIRVDYIDVTCILHLLAGQKHGAMTSVKNVGSSERHFRVMRPAKPTTLSVELPWPRNRGAVGRARLGSAGRVRGTSQDLATQARQE